MSPEIVEILDEYYKAQADWTYQSRNYVYRRTGILGCEKPILELGCATGVIAKELSRRSKGLVIGIDSDEALLQKAINEPSSAVFVLADAGELPFKDASFPAVLFHFALMWFKRPEVVIKESRRVLCSGGFALVLAEPDYSGAVEVPSHPSLKDVLVKSVLEAGGDPFIAPKLPSLFLKAGFNLLETGGLSKPLTGSEVLKTAPMVRLLTETGACEKDYFNDFRPTSIFYPVYYFVFLRR